MEIIIDGKRLGPEAGLPGWKDTDAVITDYMSSEVALAGRLRRAADGNTSVPKGSRLCLSPRCRLKARDLKDYTVVRDPSGADYMVMEYRVSIMLPRVCDTLDGNVVFVHRNARRYRRYEKMLRAHEEDGIPVVSEFYVDVSGGGVVTYETVKGLYDAASEECDDCGRFEAALTALKDLNWTKYTWALSYAVDMARSVRGWTALNRFMTFKEIRDSFQKREPMLYRLLHRDFRIPDRENFEMMSRLLRDVTGIKEDGVTLPSGLLSSHGGAFDEGQLAIFDLCSTSVNVRPLDYDGWLKKKEVKA